MTDYTDAILAASVTDELHSHVSDTEAEIIVNEGSRDFSFSEGFNMVIGVVGDKNSEAVSFKMPRFIDSHDISECAQHRILWKNEEAGLDGYFDSEDIKISESEEDKLILGWLISDEVTAAAGEISFALQISDYDADGQLSYRWQTLYGHGLLILEGPESEVYPEKIRKSYVPMVDQVTGKKYKLYVSYGKLMIGESEE